MFLKVIIPLMLASCAFAQYTPSTDTYVLNTLIPYLNATKFLFDGPANVTYAPTTPTTNARPTLAQMMYYNYYSASMYCQYQLEDLSCTYCAKFKNDIVSRKIIQNVENDLTALVTISDKRKEIVVAFRGTQNIWNLLLDFTLVSVCYDYPDCNIKLHAGFYKATRALYDEVVKSIGSQLVFGRKNYKIVLTGHSLGGAIARGTTFFLLYMNQFPNNEIELYTYGEPRLGNKYFADYMNAQNITTVRVTARADLGPHLMPVSILGYPLQGDYYVHPQTEYWINGATQKFADTSRYVDPDCCDQLGPAYSVIDHFQYFDADYLVCWLNQPAVWLALPGGIISPTRDLPPLPPLITSFLGGLIGFVMISLLGLLG